MPFVSEKRSRIPMAGYKASPLVSPSPAHWTWSGCEPAGRKRNERRRRGCVAVSQKGPLRSDVPPMTLEERRLRRREGVDTSPQNGGTGGTGDGNRGREPGTDGTFPL